MIPRHRDDMTDDYADPRTLNYIDLVRFAKALLVREDKRTHWSVAAIVLGRITDECIYARTEYGAYGNEEEWAKETLGMTRGEFRLALKLYRLMGRASSVSAETWLTLSKPRALLLDEVLAAGGDITEWCMKAKGTTTRDFEAEVRRQLKEDVFLTLTIRYPESMKEMVEEAFRRALHYGYDEPIQHDPARWRDSVVVFQALEVLCQSYLQETEPIPETP